LMNLDDLHQTLGIPFDGLLGQDMLREFRSVRVDYRATSSSSSIGGAPHHANKTMFRPSY
jgi:hypothetical protein